MNIGSNFIKMQHVPKETYLQACGQPGKTAAVSFGGTPNNSFLKRLFLLIFTASRSQREQWMLKVKLFTVDGEIL